MEVVAEVVAAEVVVPVSEVVAAEVVAPVAVAPTSGASAFIRDIVLGIGVANASVSKVREVIAAMSGGSAFLLAKEKQLNSLVSSAKKKVSGGGGGGDGEVKQRVTTSSSRSSSEPTITQLMEARAVCQRLSMKPSDLQTLVSQLVGVGDLTTLDTCLQTLVTLSGDV